MTRFARSPKSIESVAAQHLCSGCGACAYLEPERFEMADATDVGRRPRLKPGAAETTGLGIRACPGAGLDRSANPSDPRYDGALFDAWGPVLAVFEGYASDPEIRHAGSSGGAASALALYCLERQGADGVVHTAAADTPVLNETRVSTSRAELLAATGSRYAPASPCDGLSHIENAKSGGVFIGKPCDVAGLQAAAKLRPQLQEKCALAIAFFCAGVPSTQGTLDLLKRAGAGDPDKVRSLRYRGKGWPGMWTAKWRDDADTEREAQLSYEDSWGFLTSYVQWRCRICPDHTGEFADVAVGDPWYRAVEPGEHGKSLIVARTQRGLDAVKAAAEAGYIVLERSDPSLLPRSQPNLLGAHSAVWGRVFAMGALGLPVPSYRGFRLFRLWLRNMSLQQKIRSVLGTARRIVQRRMWAH